MENGKTEFLFKTEYVAPDKFDNWARPAEVNPYDGRLARYTGPTDSEIILRQNEDPCK